MNDVDKNDDCYSLFSEVLLFLSVECQMHNNVESK